MRTSKDITEYKSWGTLFKEAKELLLKEENLDIINQSSEVILTVCMFTLSGCLLLFSVKLFVKGLFL